MYFRFSTSRLTLSAAVLLLLSVGAACKKGEVIEEIGKNTITTKDYEDFYSTSIERAVRLGNVEKATLYEWICKPEKTPNAMIGDMVFNLQPEENYKRYKDLKIIEQATKENGFADRPVVKQILELNRLENLASLYMQEKMDERIKITTEMKKNRCDDLRKQFPEKVGALTLDDCLKVAEGVIKKEIINKEYQKLVEEIKESVVVHRNPNFKKEDYLKNGVPLYKVIQKEGKCEDSPAPAKNPTP